MSRFLFMYAPLGGLALYFSGVFGGDYSRVVDRPPAVVAEALQNMDFDPAAGAPDNASRLMKFSRTSNELVWSVMSGGEIATEMIVDLEPLENGTKTRVTAHVERGAAADDKITPVFRSEGATLGLLAVSLENRLDRLTSPSISPEKCQEIIDSMNRGAPEFSVQSNPRNLGDAIGMHAEQTVRLNALMSELKRNGCHPGFKDTPPIPPKEMVGPGQPASDPNINFTAGQPMINPNNRN